MRTKTAILKGGVTVLVFALLNRYFKSFLLSCSQISKLMKTTANVKYLLLYIIYYICNYTLFSLAVFSLAKSIQSSYLLADI